jgi:Fic family protein
MATLIQLQNLKKQLDLHKPFSPEIMQNLDEWYKVELTYTSNAIEGNTLTRQETALVVEKGITVEGKSIVEHLEAINHAKAWEYVVTLQDKNIIDITEHTIRNIHSIILQGIDMTNAGRYRTVPVRISGSMVVLPNPLKVPSLMKEFITNLQISKNNVVDVAIRAYFDFVSIHPFSDGNGRTGRLLMNLILIQGGFPPAIIRKEDRKAYINSIEKGQLHNDLSDYYALMYSAVERSLCIYLESIEPKEVNTSIPKKLLKIGELAKAAGESVPTIRYWTKEGLLYVAELSKGGYQMYLPDMIERVKQIRSLQTEKRLTIEELKKTIK